MALCVEIGQNRYLKVHVQADQNRDFETSQNESWANASELVGNPRVMAIPKANEIPKNLGRYLNRPAGVNMLKQLGRG